MAASIGGGAVSAQDTKPNTGPRQTECDALASLVSTSSGRGVSHSYGPRYTINLPRSQDRYNGITVYCDAEGDAASDQIEFHSASKIAIDQMLPLIATVAARFSRETADRSQRAAAACLARTRATTDQAQNTTGNLKVTCRTTISGDELQIQKLK
jgi:hypothetical protein